MAAGPEFVFNPSISLSIWHNDEKTLDEIWDKLTEEGEVMMEYQSYDFAPKYGWCNDKFGLSWQVMLTNSEPVPSLSPSLMFTHENNGKAKEAIEFYTSLFPSSEIGKLYEYGENPFVENSKNLSHAEFKLCGEQFLANDSGLDHKFDFNESISFIINCKGQEEVDFFGINLSQMEEKNLNVVGVKISMELVGK